MKTQNNKTKITSAVIASLIIGLVMISPTTVIPNVDAQQQKPANAITITDGGWITPLMTHDDKGNPITLQYVKSERIFGYPDAVTCTTHAQGLYQEGGNWLYSAGSYDIGLKTTWTMPTGSVSGSTSGMYYNPVNFHYTGTMTGNVHPYTFFQVDWGIGSFVKNGWFFTMMYHDSSLNKDIYEKYTMSGVTATQGLTYVVQGALEPSDMSSTPSYVVQVTQGTHGWIFSQPLTYNPQVGKLSGPSSYQDEYLQDPGSTTLGADTEASPAILADINSQLTPEPSEITGFNGNIAILNTGDFSQYNTYSAFASSYLGTTSFSDPNQCNNW